MNKLICLVAAFIFSASAFANTTNLAASVTHSLQTSNSSAANTTQNKVDMIYGGQDVATADESLWSGQPNLIG